MSPVTRFGARCRRCQERPAWNDGLCKPCWRLLTAFGRDPSDVGPTTEPEAARARVPDAAGDEFERALRAWLGRR